MSRPSTPADGGPQQAADPWQPPPGEAATAWMPPPAPSWAPVWQPPPAFGALPGVPPAASAPTAQRHGPLVLVLVAVAGVLVGAVGGGLLAGVLFVAGAQDIGRGMGEEFTRSMEDAMGLTGEWVTGPVEEFAPTEPGSLGPDPVLDAYAAGCFAGGLQACDDLYYESPPLSPYEEYGATCGGRVKQYAVMSCTELE
jgi:hypothetical protein